MTDNQTDVLMKKMASCAFFSRKQAKKTFVMVHSKTKIKHV